MSDQLDTILERAVATIGKEHFKTEIRSGFHNIIADEPMSSGGQDLGLNPFALLLAALTSCTAGILRSYADRKN